jgi:TRAP-type mannitol/chloroaromatic compound transport system substrate-binding protein
MIRIAGTQYQDVAEAGSGDDLSKKIYASYEQFRASIMDWSDLAERAFLNARALG